MANSVHYSSPETQGLRRFVVVSLSERGRAVSWAWLLRRVVVSRAVEINRAASNMRAALCVRRLKLYKLQGSAFSEPANHTNAHAAKQQCAWGGDACGLNIGIL